jgi:exopolysaccharide biosynthesis protein
MTILRTAKLLPILLALLALSSITRAPVTNLAPAVTYVREIRKNPDLRLYSITIDLTDPTVRIKVSRGGVDATANEPWTTTLLTVTEMAKRDHLVGAINGSPFGCKDAESILGFKYPYFDGNYARPVGWSMSDGVLLTQHPKHPDWPALVVVGKNHPMIGQFDALPAGAMQAVTGTFAIVQHGQSCRLPDPNPDDPALRAPRTAVGINQDGTKLILLVVDGRRPGYSVGISEYQVGQEMLRLGAWTALILDSGGSSTMVARSPSGGVNLVNRPSDGHDLPIPLSIERSVPDALGVVIDAQGDQDSPAAAN